MNKERLGPRINKKLLALEAGVILLVSGAASPVVASPKENKPACVEPTPNAMLIPLARPGDDKVELIPLARPGDDKVELIPLAPIAPSCPIVQEA